METFAGGALQPSQVSVISNISRTTVNITVCNINLVTMLDLSQSCSVFGKYVFIPYRIVEQIFVISTSSVIPVPWKAILMQATDLRLTRRQPCLTLLGKV